MRLNYGGRLDLFSVRYDLQTPPDIQQRDKFFSPRLAFGKVFAKRIDARFEIENVTNNIYLINLGSEFNGSQGSLPRQITRRLGYRF